MWQHNRPSAGARTRIATRSTVLRPRQATGWDCLPRNAATAPPGVMPAWIVRRAMTCRTTRARTSQVLQRGKKCLNFDLNTVCQKLLRTTRTLTL